MRPDRPIGTSRILQSKTYIFQIAEQVGDSFPLIIGEGGFVDAIARPAGAQAGGDITPLVDGRQTRPTGGEDSTHASSTGPHQGTSSKVRSSKYGEGDWGRDNFCGEMNARWRLESVAYTRAQAFRMGTQTKRVIRRLKGKRSSRGDKELEVWRRGGRWRRGRPWVTGYRSSLVSSQ